MIDITEGKIVGGALMVPYQTIFENIAGAYTLQTFTALSMAGCLSDLLSDKGPFTVFVPNDKAFGNMKKQMIYTLFEKQNKQKLLTLLAQYVLIGNFRTENFKEGEQEIYTIGGDIVTVIREDKRVWINSHLIEVSNVSCSNGTIHILPGLISL